MLELVMAVSQSRRLPDRALHDGAGAELEVGIRAMLLACSGAMTHYKLERLRTLRRRRKAARRKNSPETSHKAAIQPFEVVAQCGRNLRIVALIPPGEFLMGSPQSERGGGGYEQQHGVCITKPFYLGVYEITQSEFEQVMGRNPSDFLNSGGQIEVATGVDTSRYPVDSVTWYEAIEFCNKLSEKDGRQPYYRLADAEREGNGSIKEAQVSVAGGGGYRLPTEAQWEYACRAGTTTPFNFGTANNGAECNCNGKAPYGTEEQGPSLGSPIRVGSYRPNACGLYDMHGNVWEWCWDVFDAYQKNSPESDAAGSSRTPKVTRKKSQTKNSPESDPAGPTGDLHRDRVNRRSSFVQTAGDCRAAARGWSSPGWRSLGLGFRVVCEHPQTPSGEKAGVAVSSQARSLKDHARRVWKGSYSMFKITRPRKWRETLAKDGATFDFQEVRGRPNTWN
jgi:formylglycine-generating enzyme required for sulfatase activity